MTTDLHNSEFRVSLVGNFGVLNPAKSCDDAAQGTRLWEVPGRARNIPVLKLRLPPRRVSDATLHPSAIHSTGHALTAGRHCQSPTEQLLTSAQEDIARLNEILRTQQCTAVMCGAAAEHSSPHEVSIPVHGGRNNIRPEKLHPPSGASTLATPIFDAEGRPVACLAIIQDDAASWNRSEPLLRALAEPAARAITERWFRLIHRRHFVIAAMRRNAPRASVVFAMGRDQQIVGADRQARQLVEQRGQQLGHPLVISALFRANPALLRRRGYGDVATTLFASDDGEPWVALVTPPDTGAMESYRDPRVLLHVRPRLDALTYLSSLPSIERAKRGLSQLALHRVEEYIEAHLDSALDIDELAGIVRMSSSHFTRSFHKSVGVTPHRFVIQNRVMRARELLATTNLPLTEIALTTGFSDQSHFSRRFHEVVGVPPGAFRGHDGVFAQ